MESEGPEGRPVEQVPEGTLDGRDPRGQEGSVDVPDLPLCDGTSPRDETEGFSLGSRNDKLFTQ